MKTGVHSVTEIVIRIRYIEDTCLNIFASFLSNDADKLPNPLSQYYWYYLTKYVPIEINNRDFFTLEE